MGQLEPLLAIAHKKDVFVHMRTGGGKSLCVYGVPLAIGGEAMGVIISPLVSSRLVSSMPHPMEFLVVLNFRFVN